MSGPVLRHSSRDAILVGLAGLYGVLFLAMPSAALIAVGVWWIANTVAHTFIHLPFFTSRRANRAFSLYLSLLLGVPQALWRDRHLAHHAERTWRMRWTPQLVLESVAVGALWIALATRGSMFFFGTWLAGWMGAMLLCTLHGRLEHVRGTVSHYGRVYNATFFNDGYHVEHHARPDQHWTLLPRAGCIDGTPSRWPAVLRWIELLNLNALERVVLKHPVLQRFVVDSHARALAKVISTLPPVRRVTVVGGGLFPRTALVLRRLVPEAEITIVDRSAASIRSARPFLDARVRMVEATYPSSAGDAPDLVVIPLAFAGDKAELYARPPAPTMVIHDWIWRVRGPGHIVSLLLLKRVNLVCR